MALLWPVENHTFSIPHGLYVALLGAGLSWGLAVRAARHVRRPGWSPRRAPLGRSVRSARTQPTP
jgi:hypothetical protein